MGTPNATCHKVSITPQANAVTMVHVMYSIKETGPLGTYAARESTQRNVSKTTARSQPANGVRTRCKNQTPNHMHEHCTLLLQEVFCYTWNNAV